jgi:hypothetical protein
MAFAFARVYAAGTDDAEGLSTLDEAHYEQSAFTRITDDHLSMFADGMIRIVFDASDIVIEDSLCFSKRDSVLAEVAAFLRRIPVEYRHSGCILASGSIVLHATVVNRECLSAICCRTIWLVNTRDAVASRLIVIPTNN